MIPASDKRVLPQGTAGAVHRYRGFIAVKLDSHFVSSCDFSAAFSFPNPPPYGLSMSLPQDNYEAATPPFVYLHHFKCVSGSQPGI